MESHAPTRKPRLTVIGGQVFIMSMTIAEHFGKQHKNVIREKRNLACSERFRRLNFEECFKFNELANGRREPYDRLTRNGFLFLAVH